MKHINGITKTPRRAQDLTTSGIITIISQLLAVIGQFVAQKDAAQPAA